MAVPTEPILVIATAQLSGDGFTNKESPTAPVTNEGYGKQGLPYQQANYLWHWQANWLKYINEEQIPNLDQYLQNQITINKTPTGVPLPWTTDVAPDGHAFMKGQAFDTNLYPELALAYPTGIIPDMRDLAIVGTGDTESVLSYEADGLLRHTHTPTLGTVDLGTKTTSTYTHTHDVGEVPYNGAPINNSIDISSGTSSGGLGTIVSSSDTHDHTVVIGSHGHTISIAELGGDENTIKNRKFNYIVRLA